MKIFKIAGITLAIFSLIGAVTYGSLKPKSKSKINNQITIQKKTDKQEEKINQGEIKVDEQKEKLGESSDNSSNDNALNDKKSDYNTQIEIIEEKNSNTSYVQENNSTITSLISTDSSPQNPWERLGISENDYYNSPAPNEGEIAFRESESKCDSVATSITNTYGFVTHFGDVYSYSESYIGCWITVHLPDGRKMFYNEFISRANRGEF